MGIYTYKTNINIGDVGENNQLSNKGFLRLMQEAAALHSDSVGYGINDVEETNLIWIILNWKLQIFSRPKWNTKVILKTWSKPIQKFYCYRDIQIFDENNNLLGIATTKWLLINTKNNSICRVPKELEERYGVLEDSVFKEKFNEKLVEPEILKENFKYKIQKRDVDTNHHVNNINYLDFAIEALPKECNKLDFKRAEIMYKNEIKLNEKITCSYFKESDLQYIIVIKDKHNLVTHAIIKFSL